MNDEGGQPAAAVPAGWYPDPGQAGAQRWWDGMHWTAHASPAPEAAPVGAATYSVASGDTLQTLAPSYATPAYLPQKKSHKGLWITLGVVGTVVAVLIGMGVVLALQDRSGAKKVVSAYLSNLERGNYQGAYQQLCAADQAQVSEQQFATAKAAVHPVSFRIVKTLVHGGSATTAQVFYDDSESDGQLLESELPAQKSHGTWQVCHALEPGGWIGIR